MNMISPQVFEKQTIHMAFSVDSKRAKRILVLAAPIVIAMLTQTFINVVDTVFVGKLDPSVSIPGQAALGYSLPLLWAISGSLAAIGVGTQVMTARRYGAGELQNAGKILHNSVIVAIISSILMSFAAWFFIPYAFEFLTPNRSVTELGIPYARVRIIGALSFVATTAYKGFFDGIGKTRVHMYAAIVMNFANIFLNYMLIFGVGPIPSYGVTGAAIASLISTFIGLGVMIFWTFKKDFRAYKIYRPTNFSMKTIWELIKLSVPSGLAQIFIMSGVLMFLKIIGSLDEQATTDILNQMSYYKDTTFASLASIQAGVRDTPNLGIHALASDWHSTIMWSRPPLFTTAAKLIIDLLSIGFVTCIAFGTATATMVSQSMGRKRFNDAAAYGWDSVKMGMYFYGVLGLVVILAPEFFLDLLSDDPIVIQAAIPGLRIMAGLEMFVAMSLVLTQALFGAGDTKFVMIVEFVLHGLCLAPLAFLFGIYMELGFIGVWLSATVYLGLLSLVMAIKFWRGGWKSITV